MGPGSLRGRNYHARCSRLGPSSRVGAFVLPGAAAASLPVRVWVAAPFGFRLGAWPSACVGAFAQPDAAAAASPPGALRLAVPFRLRLGAWGVASRWPFDPLGAAGARCSRLCRLDFGRDMHRFGPPLCVGGTSYRSCGRAGRSGPGLQGLSCPARIISGRAGILRFPGFMDWPWMPVLRCALQYCAQTMSSSVISTGQTAHFPSPPPSPRGQGS